MVARGALTRGHSIMPKDNDRPVLKMEKLGFAAFLRDNENSCARSLLSKQSGKPALPYSTLANRFASLQADVALDEPLHIQHSQTALLFCRQMWRWMSPCIFNARKPLCFLAGRCGAG